ncbi:hypothetical protein [Mesorhizobium sp.]|uniref:hypothetical protein n=1 Tax=Mesorhizobium sp. TaxID=1871066 RepID=UPI0011F4FEF0|nr:hypothetical protein [Mesorhizobium sp.]TIM48782.1 MAG: hypothetical protein E5Y56_06155 [Mesorhizobium sp.]
MNRTKRERTRRGRRVDGTRFERVAAAVRVDGGVRETVSLDSFEDGPRFHVYRLDSFGVAVPREFVDLAHGYPADSTLLRRERLAAAAAGTRQRAILRANPASPADHLPPWCCALLWAIEDYDHEVLRAAGLDPVAILDMDELPIADEGGGS